MNKKALRMCTRREVARGFPVNEEGMFRVPMGMTERPVDAEA